MNHQVSDSDPVREAVAEALAHVRQPELSTFSEDQVRAALNPMFGNQGLEPRWLDWLRDRVQEISQGGVTLENADSDDFLYLSKEWGAAYQRLTAGDIEQLVIIGRGSPSFQFVPHK